MNGQDRLLAYLDTIVTTQVSGTRNVFQTLVSDVNP
jgi:hypothetical protein